MRPLHIAILVADPTRDDVADLVTALRNAGHVVLTGETTQLPPGVPSTPDFVVTEGAAMPAPETLEAAEARHVRAVLHYTGGNKRQAALWLGIARSTLLAKIRKYGLD